MRTRKTAILLNTLTNYLRFGITAVIFFLLTPFIIDRIGTEDFGLWSLVFSILGFFGLMDFGFSTGAVKYVAECKGSGDDERRNRILSTLAVAYGVLALMAAGGIGLLSVFFDEVFTIPNGQQGKAIMLLWILGARAVVFGMPLALFRAILFGEQRICAINVVQSCTTVGYALGSWYALTQGTGVIGLAVINLVAMLVEHGVYIALTFSRTKRLRIAWRLADRRLFKEVVSFSAFAFITNVSALILLRTDPMIVKLFHSLSAVAAYVVALRISEYMLLLTKQFVNVLTPLIAELGSADKEKDIRRILIDGTKFALAPGMIVGSILCIYGREIIECWLGPDFRPAGPVLQILAASMVLVIPQLMAANVLSMTGRQRFTGLAAVLSATVNITVSLLLVGPLGLVGIAFGTFAAVLIVDVFIVVPWACRQYAVGAHTYIRHALLPAVLPGVAPVVLMYTLRMERPPSSLVEIALQALPGVLLYVALFGFHCLKYSGFRSSSSR